MYLLRKSSKNFAHIQEKSKIFIYFQHNAHHAHISNTETQKKKTPYWCLLCPPRDSNPGPTD